MSYSLRHKAEQNADKKWIQERSKLYNLGGGTVVIPPIWRPKDADKWDVTIGHRGGAGGRGVNMG